MLPSGLLTFDPDSDPVLDPQKLIRPDPRIPQACVLCFFQDAIAHRVEQLGGERVTELKSEIGPSPIYRIGNGQDAVALVHPGVGAALAAGFLEELIALGCRRFVACGGAGALRQDLKVGRLVLVTEALRDEGTSYHYLPREARAIPSPSVNQSIRKAISNAGMDCEEGPSWTTDAIYRETRTRVKERQAQGCLTVEMEAAALFAVAMHRKVDLGCLLYCGDMVAGEEWDGRGWQNRVDVRRGLLGLALDAARELG